MDNGEPEESSSSQSVNIFIASIKERGAGGETVKVSLSTGSSFFMPLPLPEDWIEGKSLDEENLLFLKQENSHVKAREWAASRLALREDSSGRFYQKLLQKGFDPDICRTVLDEMKALGFLDDRRFASLWMKNRLQSCPEGRKALLAGLLQRGVDRDAALSVLEHEMNEEDESDALERCFLKLTRMSSCGTMDEKAQLRLKRQLLRRGFSLHEINRLFSLKFNEEFQEGDKI